MEEKKRPDNVVFNDDTGKYDANTKNYPTTIGSQKFEITKVDKSDAIKAEKYFNNRLEELKKEQDELVNEHEATSLIYSLNYTFQPTFGEIYHIYIDRNGYKFLSIIKPNEWDKEYVGSYKLNSNGVWEKVNYGDT